ncbi:hypothetical protein JHK85_006472 [Glycine max]|nr:hypothetical protein JHK85_006472 [Glycine max]
MVFDEIPDPKLMLSQASNAVLHQLPTEACVFIRYAAAHRLTDPPYNLEPEPNDLSCGPWEQGRFRHFDDDDDEKFPNGYLNAQIDGLKISTQSVKRRCRLDPDQ